MHSMKYEQVNLNQIFQEDIDSKVNTLDNSHTQRSNKDNQMTMIDTERNNSIDQFQPNEFNFKNKAIDFIKQNRYNSKVKHVYEQYDRNPKEFLSNQSQIKVQDYDQMNDKREETANGKLRPWSPQDALNFFSNYKKSDNPADVTSTINSIVQTFQSDKQNNQIQSRRISMHQKSQAHEKDWINFSKNFKNRGQHQQKKQNLILSQKIINHQLEISPQNQSQLPQCFSDEIKSQPQKQELKININDRIIGKVHIGKLSLKNTNDQSEIDGFNRKNSTIPSIKFRAQKFDQLKACIEQGLNKNSKERLAPKTSQSSRRPKIMAFNQTSREQSYQKSTFLQNQKYINADIISKINSYNSKFQLSHRENQFKSTINVNNFTKNHAYQEILNQNQDSILFTNRGQPEHISRTLNLNFQNNQISKTQNSNEYFQKQSYISDQIMFNPLSPTSNNQVLHKEIDINNFKYSYGKARADLAQIKNKKIRTDLEPHQLIQTCREKFSNFFTNDKVQMVTEQQVIDGFSKFHVLFDPEKVKEIQAQVDKINAKNEKIMKLKDQIKNQEKNLSEKIDNIDKTVDEDNLLEYVELEANNQMKQKKGDQIPSYMLATMIQGLDQAQNIKGIENQNHIKKINKTIFNLEQREIQIIGDLYKQHFSIKKDNDSCIEKPEIQQNDSQLLSQPKIQFNQNTIITEDPSNLISNDSKNILDNYSIQGKKEANIDNSQKFLRLPNITRKQSTNTGLQSPIDQFTNSKLIEKMTIHEDQDGQKVTKKDKKLIIYIPNNLGKSHLDLDIALKSIFTNQGSQSSVSPRGKNKFNWVNTQESIEEEESTQEQKQGFISGNQKNNCYGNHMHSKECSKVKDIDLAQLQSVAFQFMVVQKPDLDLNNQKDSNLKASFYPHSKLTYELQQNFETNDLVRKLMNIPSKKIQKIYEKRIDDYLKDKSIREDILPGQFQEDDQKFDDNLNKIIQGINYKTSTSQEENLKRILFRIGTRNHLQKIRKDKKYRKSIKKDQNELEIEKKIDMDEIDEASEISTEQEFNEKNQLDINNVQLQYDNQNVQILKSKINENGNDVNYYDENNQSKYRFGYRKSVQLKNCLNLNQVNQKVNQVNDKTESKKISNSNMYRNSKNHSNIDLEDSINTRMVHTRQTSSNYALPQYNSQENYQSKDLYTTKKMQHSREINIQNNNNLQQNSISEPSQIFESAQTLKKNNSGSPTPKSQNNIKISYNVQQKKSLNGLTKLNLKENSYKKSGLQENPSPLSNESIKYLSAKENMLNQKYQNRLMQEQLKSQQQFEINIFELIKVQQELKRRQEQGFNPKLVWKSPFEHRQSIKQNQRDSLKQKEVKNIEKIYQTDFQKKVQIEFKQWSFTDLYKRQLQLAALAQQYQLKYSLIANQNLIKLQNVRQNFNEPRKSHIPNESFSDEISPIKIKFLDNKYNDNQHQLSNSLISEPKNSENKNIIGNVIIPLAGIEENSSSIQENPQQQTQYREGFLQEQRDQQIMMESSQDPNFSKNGIDLVSQGKISATSEELKNIDEMLDTNQFSINVDTTDGFTPQRYRSPRKTIEIQIKQQNKDETLLQQEDQYQTRDNMVPAIFNDIKVHYVDKPDKKQNDVKAGEHQASFLKLQFSQRSKRSQYSKEDNQDLINTFNEERDLLSSDRMKSKQSRGHFSNKKVSIVKSREREAAEVNNVVLELGNVKIQKYPQNFLQKVRGTLTRGGIQKRHDIVNYHAITPVTQMMDQTDMIEQHSTLNPTLANNYEMQGDKKVNKNLLNVVIQTKKGDKIENVFQSKKISQTSIEEMGSTESKRLNKQILEISELKKIDILAAAQVQQKVTKSKVKSKQDDENKIVLKQKKFIVGEDLMHLMTFRQKKIKNKSSSPPNLNSWKVTNKVTAPKNTRPKLF